MSDRLMPEQMTREQAIQLFDAGTLMKLPVRERALFQMRQDHLCYPFVRFHADVEEVLGRAVWSHEFAQPDRLYAEMLGAREAPSFADIVAMLPEDKRVIVLVESSKERG